MSCVGSSREWLATCRSAAGRSECRRSSDTKHRQIREHHQRAEGKRTRSAKAPNWVSVEHTHCHFLVGDLVLVDCPHPPRLPQRPKRHYHLEIGGEVSK